MHFLFVTTTDDQSSTEIFYYHRNTILSIEIQILSLKYSSCDWNTIIGILILKVPLLERHHIQFLMNV